MIGNAESQSDSSMPKARIAPSTKKRRAKPESDSEHIVNSSDEDHSSDSRTKRVADDEEDVEQDKQDLDQII